MVMGSNKNNSSHHGADNFLRSEIYEAAKVIIRNLSAKLLTECIQEMPAFKNLPPRAPVQNMQPQFGLQFINKVRDPSFTTNLVRDDNGSPIKVAIYDTSTQSIISPDNFLSSAKVKITVLNAEFVENKGETLSRGEFNQSVLKERERKGPVLTGRSRIIQLENGVGTFENIVFNDNSSWTKNGFRLGVMVVSDGEEGYFNGERVQEGVSEPFRVKDRRMKASQKPDQLKLTHKVQSLKKVGKDRASLLQKKNINTVEDFLNLYYNDEPTLREILCIKSESGKEWDSMVEHATQCANEFHAKYSSQPRQALVHPIEGNLSLFTNGGSSVVGSGSSEPNPTENDLIEGDVPAINRQHAGFPKLELCSDLISMKNMYADAELTPNHNTQAPLGKRPPYPRFRGTITWENRYQKHEFSVWS